jgi:hypothetical protein
MSSVNSPCVANNNAFSGYMPVNNNQPTPAGTKRPNRLRNIVRGVNNVFETRQNRNGAATFTYTQNTAGTQMWFCSAAAHCQNGMALAVNVVGNNAAKRQASTTDLSQMLSQYQKAARKVRQNGQASVPAGTGGTLSQTAVKLQTKNNQAATGKKNPLTALAGLA